MASIRSLEQRLGLCSDVLSVPHLARRFILFQLISGSEGFYWEMQAAMFAICYLLPILALTSFIFYVKEKLKGVNSIQAKHTSISPSYISFLTPHHSTHWLFFMWHARIFFGHLILSQSLSSSNRWSS